MSNMCQYTMWGNCSNHCDFCLCKDKRVLTPTEMIWEIEETKKNLSIVDWSDTFSDGISLLGGELFFITDKAVQNKFMELIDLIIEDILYKVPTASFSCVTNGIYEPTFLYRVMDRFKDTVGMSRVDVNFSYDLKYRFHTKDAENTAKRNIINFMDRYSYTVAVQMILTQYIIDLCQSGQWSPNTFETEYLPGIMLSFLYPHPIYDGKETVKELNGFKFSRKSLLWFVPWLMTHNNRCYHSFISSCYNSGIYKWTGRYTKNLDGLSEGPQLAGGKEKLLPCGHSILYQCYSDSQKCMMCDLENIAEEL